MRRRSTIPGWTGIHRRRGVTAVLAMLFMILFATLAIGFVALIGSSTQISHNDAESARTMLAAESAMQFARYHLARIDIEKDANPEKTFDNLYAALAARLNGTINMASHNPTRTLEADGTWVIDIPGRSGGAFNHIDFGGGIGLGRISIRMKDQALDVRAYGTPAALSAVRRGIQYDFEETQALWTIPGPGVLTRSPIEIGNGAKIFGGDVTSATASTAVASMSMTGGSKIGGDFYYVDGALPPTFSNGAKLDGEVIRLDDPPSFPVVDTSAFEQFVPARSAAPGPKVITRDNIDSFASNHNFINIRIKANNTGSTIAFGNSQNLYGVIWVETPNRISFGGGGRLTAIIVTDNGTVIAPGGNRLTLDNGVRMYPLSQLDPADFTAGTWAAERLDELKAMKTPLILAPRFELVLAGGLRTYEGAMVADAFDISNGYKGTIAGALIGLGEGGFRMMGGGQVDFAAGESHLVGLYRGGGYRLDASSYAELDD
jgi:hypothetical protein